jgi:Flp pilus assembly protein TadB
MTTSEDSKPRHQSFYGAGSVGGDNKGIINNVLVDQQTKAYLAVMHAKAPELADLFRRSLNEGFISPAVAQSLVLAARNINEDVAMSLRMAGENINEDVATDLRTAAQHINADVAERFAHVKTGLDNTAEEIDQSLSSLRQTVKELKGLQTGMVRSQPEPVGTTPVTVAISSRGHDTWVRIKVFLFGSGLGLVAAILLMNRHHPGWAAIAAAAAMATPLFSLVRSGMPWIKWFMSEDD